jgi:predicted small secreted protein
MRRSAIALVIIVAGMLAAACTNPSSGSGSSAGAPAPAASSAPVVPGY